MEALLTNHDARPATFPASAFWTTSHSPDSRPESAGDAASASGASTPDQAHSSDDPEAISAGALVVAAASLD